MNQEVAEDLEEVQAFISEEKQQEWQRGPGTELKMQTCPGLGNNQMI